MNDDPLPVADNEQGRILQAQGVVGQLFEGGVQVTARLLVLPAKVTALPDIGPAIAATRFFRSPFKTVAFRITGLVNSQQITEVVKMGLGSAAFAEGVVSPEADEVFRGHDGDAPLSFGYLEKSGLLFEARFFFKHLLPSQEGPRSRYDGSGGTYPAAGVF